MRSEGRSLDALYVAPPLVGDPQGVAVMGVRGVGGARRFVGASRLPQSLVDLRHKHACRHAPIHTKMLTCVLARPCASEHTNSYAHTHPHIHAHGQSNAHAHSKLGVETAVDKSEHLRRHERNKPDTRDASAETSTCGQSSIGNPCACRHELANAGADRYCFGCSGRLAACRRVGLD